MDCSPPGSSVHGILQAITPEWTAMPSSRISRPRNRTLARWNKAVHWPTEVSLVLPTFRNVLTFLFFILYKKIFSRGKSVSGKCIKIVIANWTYAMCQAEYSSPHICVLNFLNSMRWPPFFPSHYRKGHWYITAAIHTQFLLTQKLVFSHSAMLLVLTSFNILKFVKELWLYINSLKLDK